MINLENLRIENFILRELKDSDKERKELFSILNNPDIQRYLPGLYVRTFDEIEHSYILANLNNNIFLVIEDIDSKKIMGIIFLYLCNEDNANISYIMDRDKRGQGIMPKVLKFFIKHLYDNELLSEISFRINISNKSSIRVMQKLNIPFFLDRDDYGFFHLSLTEELPF